MWPLFTRRGCVNLTNRLNSLGTRLAVATNKERLLQNLITITEATLCAKAIAVVALCELGGGTS